MIVTQTSLPLHELPPDEPTTHESPTAPVFVVHSLFALQYVVGTHWSEDVQGELTGSKAPQVGGLASS